MKKIALVLALLLTASAPALAGGHYKKHRKGDTCKVKEAGSAAVDGTLWLLKLPFRVVSSTLVGTTGLLVDQDLEGFEDGYNLIK